MIGKKILIVEDSNEDFLIITRAFADVGVNKNNLFRIDNGDDAVDYLRRDGKFENETDYPLPELIILDLNLPGLDGLEVLKIAKSNKKLKLIPVIMLTTSAAEKDIEACYLHGANSYIQKPIDFTGFVETMNRLNQFWFKASTLPKLEAS